MGGGGRGGGSMGILKEGGATTGAVLSRSRRSGALGLNLWSRFHYRYYLLYHLPFLHLLHLAGHLSLPLAVHERPPTRIPPAALIAASDKGDSDAVWVALDDLVNRPRSWAAS